MKKIDKTLIERFASDLMFELNAEELDMVQTQAHVFEGYIERLQTIDTEGVDVMSYPFETETHWLREDEPNHILDRERAFKNAPRVHGDFFEVVKVVNK